jgi:diaminopimelate decarboxylase
MKPLGPIPKRFSDNERGELIIGGRADSELVQAAGSTPLFDYDRHMVAAQVARYRAAFAADVSLHYAVKANPYAPLLAELAKLVDGFDLASIGEWEKVRGLGLPVSFAGPGKDDRALQAAIRAGLTINVESEGEADRIARIARDDDARPRVAVRVNPPFGLKGSGMKMGGLASQFGVDHDRVPELVRSLQGAGAEWHGLHIYAGSQSLSADAIIELQQATIDLAAEIASDVGAAPPTINLGGGFGIPYFDRDQPLDVEGIGAALQKALENRPNPLVGSKFAIELGRWLVGEAGVYLTRIVDRKVSRGKTFLVTDGGLQHMLAASGNFGQLLRRNYPVAIANRMGGADELEEQTIVGCLCTPLDLLADEAILPRAGEGDLVAIFCAGAYGLSASPQAFLSQPEAREILV